MWSVKISLLLQELKNLLNFCPCPIYLVSKSNYLVSNKSVGEAVRISSINAQERNPKNVREGIQLSVWKAIHLKAQIVTLFCEARKKVTRSASRQRQDLYSLIILNRFSDGDIFVNLTMEFIKRTTITSELPLASQSGLSSPRYKIILVSEISPTSYLAQGQVSSLQLVIPLHVDLFYFLA